MFITREATWDKPNIYAIKNFLGSQRHEKYTAALLGILCNLATGDAKLTIRGVADVRGNGGFWALCLLDGRFNSKTTG